MAPALLLLPWRLGSYNRSAAYWRRHSGSEQHLPVRIFAFGGHQLVGLVAALRLPKTG